MVKKVFWSVAALVSSLVGFYGAVRLGWSWQVLLSTGLVAIFLIVGLLSGEASRPPVILETDDDPTTEQDLPPLLLDAETGPESVPGPAAAPRGFQWGELRHAPSAMGPTEF